MIRKLATAATLSALIPLSLAAQGPEEASRRIEAAMQRAAAAGIPVSLLENRVAEGRAKNVSEEQIAGAVERRVAALAHAHEALSPSGRTVSTADLAAGADALERGVAGQAIGAVSELARDADRPAAITVLAYLHEQGLPVGEALSRVAGALQNGPGALANVLTQVASAGGRSPPLAGWGKRGVGAAHRETVGPPASVPIRGQGRPLGKPPVPGNPAGGGGGAS